MAAYCLESIKMVLAWRPLCPRSLPLAKHTRAHVHKYQPHTVYLNVMKEKPTHKKEPAPSQTSASQLVPALFPRWERIPSQQDAFSLFTVNRPNPHRLLITARQTHFVRPIETKDSVTYFRTSVSQSELDEHCSLRSRRDCRHLSRHWIASACNSL